MSAMSERGDERNGHTAAEAQNELALMGRALGGLRWVQGPGGNVSVKVDNGELWVKASGKRLGEVAHEGGHARVPLDIATRALDGDAEADRDLFGRTPRPSLETYFHALGGRVVAHTHALGVLLYACSTSPYERVLGQGSGIALPAELSSRVFSIPYVRPGRGIALAMRDVLGSARGEALIVLRSHGVVAMAETAARAIALTEMLDEAVRHRFGSLPDIDALAPRYADSPVATVEGGVFRRLPPRVAREASPPRYLFPDAPVCASLVQVGALTDLPAVSALAARALAEWKRACILVDAEGRRAAVARSAAQLEHTCEVVAGHDWLEDALRAHGVAQYLDDDEPAGILSLPAEQYRIRLGEKTC
ncbi:class II aldolase/adducin family protein [Pendulispora albinea]|uniref:Class II aldolase/adducin family protein n=1 Tax=Pendulispora albinea TaxID=2741071 RepID=A0ABZ2LNX3_9BACT